MIVGFVTALAMALAVYLSGGAIVCGWAAWASRNSVPVPPQPMSELQARMFGRSGKVFGLPARSAALAAMAFLLGCFALLQIRAVVAYETGQWGIGNLVGFFAIWVRLGIAAALHALAYIVTRERCGFRGVGALLAAGLLAGLATTVL